MLVPGAAARLFLMLLVAPTDLRPPRGLSCWTWPLCVPVGGGPPARSPHASFARSGRSRSPARPCRRPPAPRQFLPVSSTPAVRRHHRPPAPRLGPPLVPAAPRQAQQRCPASRWPPVGRGSVPICCPARPCRRPPAPRQFLPVSSTPVVRRHHRPPAPRPGPQPYKQTLNNVCTRPVVQCLPMGRCAYPRLGLLVWAVHPIRRHCTRSDRVQRHVRGTAPRNGCSAPCVVEALEVVGLIAQRCYAT